MKTNTNSLPAKVLLAALVAIIVLPIGAAAACTAFTATGVLSVFLADYGRSLGPVGAPAEVVPFGAPHCPATEQRMAA